MSSGQTPAPEKSKYPSLLSGILVSLGTLLFIFLLLLAAEFGLQQYMIHKNGEENFRRDWMHLANVKGPFIPEEGVINQLGFHSREIPFKKDKNTYRILVIGGSAAYGWHDINTSWVWYLEKRLQKRSPNKVIEVINGGLSGAATPEELHLLRDILPMDFDMVISYDGWNDAYYTHYCGDWVWARHRKNLYDSKLDETMDRFNRALELKSYGYLTLKKSFYKFRKQLKGQTTAPEGKKASDTELVVDHFKKADKNGPPIVQCDNARVYQLQTSGKIEDNFSEIFKTNILKMAETVKRKKIPYIAILQPALSATIHAGLASPEGLKIYEETGVFAEDWLNASSQIYPAAAEILKNLESESGIHTLDLSTALQGADSAYFTDDVHYRDPAALDLIAAKVEQYLVEENLLFK